MTVAQNIAYPLKKRGVPKAERAAQVAKTAELLQLTPLLERKPRAAVGRPAAARGARAGAGAGPEGLPSRRAAVEPRREAARPHAGGARGAAPPPRADDGLRHARPARGDDDVGPHRRDGGRAAPAVRAPTEVYQEPANRFVAGFIGTPGDEPHRRAADRRRTGAWLFDAPRRDAQPDALAPDAEAGRGVPRPAARGCDHRARGPIAGASCSVVEQTGHENIVVAEAAATFGSPGARPPHRSSGGRASPCAIGFDAARAHVFAPGPDGRRLNVPAPAAGRLTRTRPLRADTERRDTLDRTSVTWSGPMPAITTPFRRRPVASTRRPSPPTSTGCSSGRHGHGRRRLHRRVLGADSCRSARVCAADRRRRMPGAARPSSARAAIRAGEVIDADPRGGGGGRGRRAGHAALFRASDRQARSFAHFETVNAAGRRCPSLLYNIPGNAGNAITPGHRGPARRPRQGRGDQGKQRATGPTSTAR